MSVLSGTFGLLTDLFFLVTVLLFMAFDTDTTRGSLKPWVTGSRTRSPRWTTSRTAPAATWPSRRSSG